ncbi:MAG: hypothetical protein Q4C61_16880 [Lachnospiraceae bacterium]|nr:hypothetical protein [Lachnospiraceae bacterium]
MNELTDRQPVEVRRGDIFVVEERRCRIFHVDEDLIFVIGLDVLFIEKYDSCSFMGSVQRGEYQKENEIQQDIVYRLSEEEQKKIWKWASVFEEILSGRYPAWERMVQPRVSKRYFYDAAERLGTKPKYLRRVFVKYLRSGRNIYSLADGRHCNKIDKKARNALLASKLPAIPAESENALSEQERQLQEALAVFKKTLSVTAAYHYLLDKYYCEPKYIDGAMKMVLLPKEQCISYKKVYNYIKDNLGGLTIKEYCKGEKDFRNNSRPLTGNARTGLVAVGQLFQIDECEIGVTIVSERDPNKVIGKAIMYCAFDPVAQIITAVNVGLKNNSYSGFCDLMLTLLEPHENQTALVDVHCTDEQFPSLILPKEIRADHGSEYESKALARAMKELGIKTSIVPVAAGSYKGGVENVFMRLQHILRQTLSDCGYIMPDHKGADKARKEACLTLKDMRRIIYKIVIDLNMALLPGYSPDREMMEAGIELSPMEIWKYEIKRTGNPACITDANRPRILYALLSQDKRFKISRAGIEYVGHNLRYFVDEEWFLQMIREKAPDYEVRYDDQSVDAVYVRYKKEIHRVPLAAKREELASFKGMSWVEYDELYKFMKQNQNTHAALNRRLETEREIRKTAETAKLLQGDVKNDTKEIKSNRKAERKELESNDTETRNRLLAGMDSAEEWKKAAVVPIDVLAEKTPSTVNLPSMDELLSLLGDDEEE